MAVDGVDVELHDGEILGFIGPNGAGKTTLFDMISGFTRINGGRIEFGGADVTEWPAYRRAAAGLGRSFQDTQLWPGLTVTETLSVALQRHANVAATLPTFMGLPSVADTERAILRRVRELIDLMGLGAFRDKFIGELSTGSRRMVELACMLALQPKVLLLDEPSSGIAQRETEALGPLIRRLRDELGCSLLIIEHDMPLISGLADHLVGLEEGAVVAYGTPQEVLNHPRVVEAYLGTAAPATDLMADIVGAGDAR
jgi:branched-chain amino acid transport system ATP-binding protein